jgi:hypothetical protein
MAQIVLFNVTNDTQYLPQRRDMFNEARWKEAKRLMAQALKLTSKEAGRYTSRFLQDRMVGADFPAPAGGCHNGITCIANGGEHSQQRGEFTVYDIIGSSYIYEAPTGDLCIANIPEDGQTEYYRIVVLSY